MANQRALARPPPPASPPPLPHTHPAAGAPPSPPPDHGAGPLSAAPPRRGPARPRSHLRPGPARPDPRTWRPAGPHPQRRPWPRRHGQCRASPAGPTAPSRRAGPTGGCRARGRQQNGGVRTPRAPSPARPRALPRPLSAARSLPRLPTARPRTAGHGLARGEPAAASSSGPAAPRSHPSRRRPWAAPPRTPAASPERWWRQLRRSLQLRPGAPPRAARVRAPRHGTARHGTAQHGTARGGGQRPGAARGCGTHRGGAARAACRRRGARRGAALAPPTPASLPFVSRPGRGCGAARRFASFPRPRGSLRPGVPTADGDRRWARRDRGKTQPGPASGAAPRPAARRHRPATRRDHLGRPGGAPPPSPRRCATAVTRPAWGAAPRRNAAPRPCLSRPRERVSLLPPAATCPAPRRHTPKIKAVVLFNTPRGRAGLRVRHRAAPRLAALPGLRGARMGPAPGWAPTSFPLVLGGEGGGTSAAGRAWCLCRGQSTWAPPAWPEPLSPVPVPHTAPFPIRPALAGLPPSLQTLFRPPRSRSEHSAEPWPPLCAHCGVSARALPRGTLPAAPARLPGGPWALPHTQRRGVG